MRRERRREREKGGKSQRVSEREQEREKGSESERGEVSCTKCFTTGDPWDHFLKKFHKKFDNILREQQDLF